MIHQYLNFLLIIIFCILRNKVIQQNVEEEEKVGAL